MCWFECKPIARSTSMHTQLFFKNSCVLLLNYSKLVKKASLSYFYLFAASGKRLSISIRSNPFPTFPVVAAAASVASLFIYQKGNGRITESYSMHFPLRRAVQRAASPICFVSLLTYSVHPWGGLFGGKVSICGGTAATSFINLSLLLAAKLLLL